jgi:hypothetical protein
MTNTRHDAGFSGMTALLLTCLGCTPLEDLSSYSAGSDDAAAPALLQAPVEEGPADPLAPTPDAGAADPPAVEAQNPADVPLIPTDTDNAADDCAGPGEFENPSATSCYLIGGTTSSWRDARDACQDWGGDLAKVESVEENTFLSEHSTVDSWLGASDFQDEGSFRWFDGDDVDPDGPWAPAQPDNFEGNENCIELREADDRWNDVPCTSAKVALCEREFGSEAGE